MKSEHAEHAEMQSLETRQLMAAAALATSALPYGTGTQLRIAGTAGADTISLSFNGTAYTVKTAAGFTKTLSGRFNSVRIDGGAGNDRIAVSANIYTPVFLYGDEGTDTLTGGSGDDYLYGGAGTNYLYGMNGRDTLVTLNGTSTDALAGGAGEDFFWVDSKSTEKIYDADKYELAHSVNRVGAFQTAKVTTTTQAVPLALNGLRVIDPKTDSSDYVYKRFDNKPLFSSAGPNADDVRQGQVGDCYFLSTLSGAAKVSPDLIRSMMVDFGDGTYGVRFTNVGGESKFYRVDNDLAVFNSTSATPAYAALGQGGSLWVAIAEKAWTYARRGQGTYDSISGGWMSEALTAVGANNQQTLWKTDAANANAFMDFIDSHLKSGDVVTMAVYDDNQTLNLVGSHAYQIVRINTLKDGSRQLVVRNPWAMDGFRVTDGKNDGYVTLTASAAFAGIDAVVAGRK
jgi:hypothetical protein